MAIVVHTTQCILPAPCLGTYNNQYVRNPNGNMKIDQGMFYFLGRRQGHIYLSNWALSSGYWDREDSRGCSLFLSPLFEREQLIVIIQKPTYLLFVIPTYVINP